MQNCVCLVAPYLFGLERLDEFDHVGDFDITGGDDVWYARHQVLFNCTLCPTGAIDDSGSHKHVSLVFFSTFEPISLTPDNCMQRKGVPMLYERAANQVLILYACRALPGGECSWMSASPAMLLEGQHGQSHTAAGLKFQREQPAGSRPDSGTGSRIFEVNIWMWQVWKAFSAQVLHGGSCSNAKIAGAGNARHPWCCNSSAQARVSLDENGCARAMDVIDNGT